MANLSKYLLVFFLAIIIAVIQSNANAINNCLIDGKECNFDHECCCRSCISNDGINHIKFCALSKGLNAQPEEGIVIEEI
jgi:hypothetical protein